jgi:hypothetical protein
MSKRIRQSPTRRRQATGWRWSAAGIRSSAFLAGPARSSSHFIAEFVQGYKVATDDRGSTSANRTQFRGGRDSLRNSVREVEAQRLPHEFGPGAVFVLPHSFQLLEHCWRQRNGKRRSGSGDADATKYDLIVPVSASVNGRLAHARFGRRQAPRSSTGGNGTAAPRCPSRSGPDLEQRGGWTLRAIDHATAARVLASRRPQPLRHPPGRDGC